MSDIRMKPDTALTILHQMLNKCRDTWEHDALIYAINLVIEEIKSGQVDDGSI